MGRRRRIVYSIALLFGLLLSVHSRHAIAEAPAPAGDTRTLALVGALIRTQTDAGDFVGNVVIQSGKILALGPNAAVPADAKRIDLTNYVVTPGLIDARSVLWLNPSAAQEGGRDGSLNILDAVDPFAEDWREVAQQGVTEVYVQPAGSGSLGGSGAVLRVGPASATHELVVRAPAALQAALGVAAPTAATADRTGGAFARFGVQAPVSPPADQPAGSNALTRYAQYEALRSQFDAAKKYGETKPAHPDPAKELLLKTVKRELPLRLEIHHEDDLRNSYNLLAELNLRVIYERVGRVKSIPAEWAAARAGLVVGPLYPPTGRDLPTTHQRAEVRNLALDGRRWAIGTFGDDSKASAWLRAHAAAAVADGYPRDRVLQALTRDAAELLGVADKAGALAVGRVADLAVFAGDPLDPSTSVLLTISQGVVTYDNSAANAARRRGNGEAASPNLPERFPQSYLLKTKLLLTPAGEFAPGELYVENGKVADRGTASLSLLVIDVGDAPVTPGLVAAHVSIGGEPAPDADASHIRGVESLTSEDARLRGYRDAGFLTTVIAPGSRNVLAGVASAVRTAGPGKPEDAGLKFVMTSTARDNERYPASLIGQVELIGDRLRGAPSQTNLYLPPAVQQALLNQREQNLAAVRTGRLAALFEVQTRTEIAAALRLIAEHKLHGVLIQPKQINDLASELSAAGLAVVIGPSRPRDSEKTRLGAVELGSAGVPLAFGAGDAAELRTTAAWLVNAGLPRAMARRALVAQPAERFGLPASCGRLTPGDAADFVIWEGDPIDPGNRPVAVVAQGQRVTSK